MNLEDELLKRSSGKCELCNGNEILKVYKVLPSRNVEIDNSILACSICVNQLENIGTENANHWRCLNESIWNENIAVQVVAYRMLNRLIREGWPKEVLEKIYFDDETLIWANAGIEDTDDKKMIHRDANGVVLTTGDNVVLIKDLKVNGSSMVAKQGTAVRNIRLDHENDAYIEGKVDGQQIVIISKYVKKT